MKWLFSGMRMDERRLFEWAIEDVVTAHPDLYLEHCVVMAVALMSRWSTSPSEFIVDYEGFDLPMFETQEPFQVRISWTERTALKAQRMLNTEQPKPIVERAAVALAAWLFANLIPDGMMRVTREGDRADYWLPRLQSALEISGTENPQEVPRRCREKVIQMLSNPRRLSGYIVVCCFSPMCRLIHWSYHRQEVKSDESS